MRWFHRKREMGRKRNGRLGFDGFARAIELGIGRKRQCLTVLIAERSQMGRQSVTPSEHDVVRGFVPATTYSSHWIRHPGLRQAVQRFLVEEAAMTPAYMAELDRLSPYRKGSE